MVSLKVIIIGAAISYSIAVMMKLTMVCIQFFNKGEEDKQ